MKYYKAQFDSANEKMLNRYKEIGGKFIFNLVTWIISFPIGISCLVFICLFSWSQKEFVVIVSNFGFANIVVSVISMIMTIRHIIAIQLLERSAKDFVLSNISGDCITAIKAIAGDSPLDKDSEKKFKQLIVGYKWFSGEFATDGFELNYLDQRERVSFHKGVETWYLTEWSFASDGFIALEFDVVIPLEFDVIDGREKGLITNKKYFVNPTI